MTGSFPPPASPALPIQIPETGDAAMQRFFHDIVDQLQTMSTRTSPSIPPSSPATSQRSSFLSPDPNAQYSDTTQFEDADEDTNGRMLSPQQSPSAASYPSPPIAPIVTRLSLRNPPRAVTRPSPRPNSAFAAVSAPVVQTRQHQMEVDTADKENSSGRRNYGVNENARPTLGLAIQSAGVPNMDMFGSERSTGSRLKKKKGSSMHARFGRILTVYLFI